MKTRIPHKAISASAGTGKTYQLSHRYIRMLMDEVEPERMVALTFSRKAAGEIFDSIMQYLSNASDDAAAAEQTAKQIEKPNAAPRDFLRLLRKMIRSLHRLHIGTLDRFTVGIVRTFPMELGLNMDLSIMDTNGAEARQSRWDALGSLFDHKLVDPRTQDQFIEAYKDATFGDEKKNFAQSLEQFISGYQSKYRALPIESAWGGVAAIWTSGSPWPAPLTNPKKLAEALAAALKNIEWHKKLKEGFLAIARFAGNYSPTSIWDASLAGKKPFQMLMEKLADLDQGETTFHYNRRDYTLSAEQSLSFYRLMTHVISVELERALGSTRGIYRVLEQFENCYQQWIRKEGKLTFDDTQYLLSRSSNLYLDYRLDCKLDHWLFDEFQDTSDQQWAVFQNLIDEVMQDSEGKKSFFYVGDVKQAIYGWRGGNAALFNQILDQYGDLIEKVPLNRSFRSCRPVIQTVNQVFSRLPGDDFSARTRSQWDAIWEDHDTALPNLSGYAAILEPDCERGEKRPDELDRFQLVGKLLNEIQPIQRGLSVGLLVRTNENGRQLVNVLRQCCPDQPVFHEGHAAILDNPVVSAILSLVRFAAHPGDMSAWRHLQMTPFNEVFKDMGTPRAYLSLKLLTTFEKKGMQAFIRHWGERLCRVCPLDDFGRRRLQDLLEAAGTFDASGSRDINLFLKFIEEYQVQEGASAAAVRVMTIHQSKGLGFDLVMLPDLQGKGMLGGGSLDLLVVQDRENKRPSWALKMPRRIVAQKDPVLAERVDLRDAQASFDELCVSYVALTRAKQGLYVITSFQGAHSATYTPGVFLKKQLAGERNPTEGKVRMIQGEKATCLYETGDASWYTSHPIDRDAKKTIEPAQLPPGYARKESRRKRYAKISPSTQGGIEERAGNLFDLSLGSSLELGTAVHELFEFITWLEEDDPDALIKTWEAHSRLTDEPRGSSIHHFKQALAKAPIQEALARPTGPCALWREKSFEIVLEDDWVTGTFDRVIIFKNKKDEISSALVQDFKTNEVQSDEDVDQAAEHYRPQMQLYRRVLSTLLNLPPEQIELQLLFTLPGVCRNL